MNARHPGPGEQDSGSEALRRAVQQLTQVADTVPTGVIITDAAGRIVAANAEAERILGVTRGDMASRVYSDSSWGITASDGTPFPDEDLAIARVLRTRQAIYGIEHRIHQPDGTAVLISINGSPLSDSDGNIIGAVASFTDITEIRRGEELLRRANRALRVLGACGHALAECTTEQELMDAVCRVVVESGYRMAWIGLALDDTERTVVPVAQAGFEEGYLSTMQVSWADTELGRGPTGTAIRTGRSVIACDLSSDTRYAPWRDEALRRGYASSMAVPLRDAEGKSFGALNIYAPCPDAFDPEEASVCARMGDELGLGILALRRQEENRATQADLAARQEQYRNVLEAAIDERTRQLHATIDTLSRASETRDRFLANMSHELRTPLNAVMGFSELLLKELAGPLNEEQRRQMEMIHDSGSHLLELITDVLDLTVIDSGEASMKTEAFSARGLVMRVVGQVAPTAAARGLALTIEDGADVRVHSDSLRVRQILLNLLTNAVKFTESGSVTVRVRVEDGFVVFDVVDTGRGIASGDTERIFEPFTQVSTSEEGRAAGTGLGLSISRRLAELLHGSLEVESELGKGSTFKLAIPLTATDAPAV